MTAKLWEEGKDPTGWLMTEKYDGMRIYWTGTEFMSRQGNKVKVPSALTSQLPSMSLDCELWYVYKSFE
jgi:DNA ligase-1